MKTINLTKGQVAIVDGEFFNWLNQWKWCICENKEGNIYAMRTDKVKGTIYMHNEILRLVSSKKIHPIVHMNKNCLDNRLHNLKVCFRSQCNGHQSKTKIKTTSIYKGVSWDKNLKKWRARIRVDGILKHLGSFHFDFEEEAARAYDKAAIKYFGEFAWLNFPEER